MPDTWKRSDLAIVRVLMSIVIIGFGLVALALLLLRWPTAGNDQGVQQITRLVGSPDTTRLTLVQRLPDLAIYLVLIAGIGFLVLALRRGERSLLIGLVGVGLLGLAYAGGMALYVGPMVSVCGFLLIVFGGMVAWMTTSSHGAAVDTGDTGVTDDTSGTGDEIAVAAEESSEQPAPSESGPDQDSSTLRPEGVRASLAEQARMRADENQADDQAPGDVSQPDQSDQAERVEPE